MLHTKLGNQTSFLFSWDLEEQIQQEDFLGIKSFRTHGQSHSFLLGELVQTMYTIKIIKTCLSLVVLVTTITRYHVQVLHLADAFYSNYIILSSRDEV